VTVNRNCHRRILPRPLLAAFMLAASFALSSAERPGLSSTFGFEGVSAPGRWNPLRVSCGGPLEGGVVEVTRRGADDSALSIESFPYAALSSIECPVFLDDELASLTVALRADGELLAEERIALRSRSFPGRIVLVSGLGTSTQAALARILLPREPVQVVALRMRDLPAQGLDYDGTSAIVLRDPGASLSPPRLEALRSWICAGGALALVRPGNGGESLASAILASAAPAWSDREFRQLEFRGPSAPASLAGFGAGRIALVSEAAENLAAPDAEAFWAEVLDLAPFGRSEGFAPGLAMPPPSHLPFHQAASGVMDLPALAFYLPCAGLFLILAFSRKRRRALFALLLAAAAAAAFVAAPPLDRSGRRDASASVRALVLPGASSLSVSLSLRGARYREGELLSPFLSRRAVEAAALGGSGRLYGGSPPRWAHGASLASVGLRETRFDELSLVALLPAGALGGGQLASLLRTLRDADPDAPLPAFPAGAKAAYLEAGGRLWLVWNGRSSSWDEAEEAPSWLALDASWLVGLSSSHPGHGFFAGLSQAPSLGFSVMGDPVEQAIWAFPFARAGER